MLECGVRGAEEGVPAQGLEGGYCRIFCLKSRFMLTFWLDDRVGELI